jgi:hypothetical protein
MKAQGLWPTAIAKVARYWAGERLQGAGSALLICVLKAQESPGVKIEQRPAFDHSIEDRQEPMAASWW